VEQYFSASYPLALSLVMAGRASNRRVSAPTCQLT